MSDKSFPLMLVQLFSDINFSRRCRHQTISLNRKQRLAVLVLTMFILFTIMVKYFERVPPKHVVIKRTKLAEYADTREIIRQNVPDNLQNGRQDNSYSIFPAKEVDYPSPNVTLANIIRNNPDVQSGGEWKPNDVMTGDTLAIVIPYRNREIHLRQLLSVLHPLLQRQRLHYRIFVVEQVNNGYFNKGLIMNIAFLVADVILRFDCVIFHDVDMVPTSYTIPYHCPRSIMPRHMSGNITDFKYNYHYLVGGVLNVPRDTFIKVNGYSNSYWGWGAEDDDLYHRMTHHGYFVDRYDVTPPYVMLPHQSRMEKVNCDDYMKRRDLSLSEEKVDRSEKDGLTTLPTHKVLAIKSDHLYTHIMVETEEIPENEDNKLCARMCIHGDGC